MALSTTTGRRQGMGGMRGEYISPVTIATVLSRLIVPEMHNCISNNCWRKCRWRHWQLKQTSVENCASALIFPAWVCVVSNYRITCCCRCCTDASAVGTTCSYTTVYNFISKCIVLSRWINWWWWWCFWLPVQSWYWAQN